MRNSIELFESLKSVIPELENYDDVISLDLRLAVNEIPTMVIKKYIEPERQKIDEYQELTEIVKFRLVPIEDK